MWFNFGFVALIGAFLLSVYRKRRSHFKAKKATLSAQEYLYSTLEYKRQLFGIENNLPNEFIFKPKNFLDNIFEKLSFSKEFKIDNPIFDDAIYINSDDTQFHKFLKENSEFTQAIINIFATTKKNWCKVKSLQ